MQKSNEMIELPWAKIIMENKQNEKSLGKPKAFDEVKGVLKWR